MGRRRTVPPAGPSRGVHELELSPLELLGAAFVALGLVVTGLVWTTVQLLARVTGGAWPDLGLAEAAGTAFRLFADPGQPTSALPERLAAVVPGAWAFWSVFAVVLTLPLGAVGGLAAWRRRRRAEEEPRWSRWATVRDLRPLAVRRPEAGRLTIGVGPRRKLLACEPGHSLLVLGPTQSGKTSGLAIPAILEWNGPVVATSVKTDLLARTYENRRERGKVWVYDPTRSVPRIERHEWSPLASSTTWQGALKTADWITRSAREGNVSNSDFWYTSAAKVLAPLLFAAASRDKFIMSDVIRWVDTQEIQQVAAALEYAGVTAARDAAIATWKRDARTRSSIYTTVENILRAYQDPAVAASAATCQIGANELIKGSNTLYVCAPVHEQARLRPVFTALVQSILNTAYETAAKKGRLEPRLLLVLDEAANIAPLQDLAQVASTAAGLGIQLLTVWQDGSQIVERYGRSAGTVINNHRAKLILSGIYDQATTDGVSSAIGEAEVTRRSTTVGFDGRLSATDAAQRQPLLSPAALRQLDPYEGVLIYGSIPPARVRLRGPS